MSLKLFDRYQRFSIPMLAGASILSGIISFWWIYSLLVSNLDESLREQADKTNQYIAEKGAFPTPWLTDEWIISFQTTSAHVMTQIHTVSFYDPVEKEKTKYRKLSYGLSLHGVQYVVSISKSMEDLDGLAVSILITTFITMTTVVLSTLLIHHFLLKKLWNPFYGTLQQLSEHKLGSGEPIDFPRTSTYEFSLMHTHLLKMIARSERDYILLKEFTENASHEIQTPLSIIRVQLDSMLQSDNLLPFQSRALENIYQSVRRLSNLGQSLLLLAKIENNQFDDFQFVDVAQRVEDKLQQMEEFWVDKPIVLTRQIDRASIHASNSLMDILLNNLLNNAYRHSPTGGSVNVAATAGMLIISNTTENGPLDADRIFTRFYKKEKNAVGNGLGLSIVKQISDFLHMDIRYEFEGSAHIFILTWFGN